MFDTSVYYAFPLAGTYSDDDPSALRRSTDGDLHYYSPHEKRFVSYTVGPSHYRVFGVDLPRALADYCAATFCRSVRDDKFYDSLRSYYQNRCRALGFNDARDTLMLDFIIHLCDEASLRTFGFFEAVVRPVVVHCLLVVVDPSQNQPYHAISPHELLFGCPTGSSAPSPLHGTGQQFTCPHTTWWLRLSD